MEKLKQKIEWLRMWWVRPENKKRTYIAIAVIVALWFVYRFIMVAVENNRFVFNATRVALSDGKPVSVIEIKEGDGEIRFPIAVKNNRAYVTASHATRLRAGMRVGDGEIASVANHIDYDTGMYTVHTRGVADGVQYVISKSTGYFVPLYAVHGDIVYVVENNVAKSRPVVVAHRDSATAHITSGVNAGDILILSGVSDGEKVNIQK